MDIQPLCGRIRFKVSDLEREVRMMRMGLLQAMHRPCPSGSVTRIIEKELMEPVIAELRRKTGLDIRSQAYVPEGHFRLLNGGRPFAAVWLPNPGTGRAFIRFLDANGRPCTPAKPFLRTDTAVEFLQTGCLK